MARIRIDEIEWNGCNVCSGRCQICCQAHGRGNSPMMNESTFETMVRDLHEIDFAVLQTSGNGDCWLNVHFLEWLTRLRHEFPAVQIVNYSNFAMLDPWRADEIISKRLLNKQCTRLDSLDPAILARTNNLNPELVLNNLNHFVKRNEAAGAPIEIEVGYSSVASYYRLCRRITGHAPFHGTFAEAEAEALPNEYEQIKERYTRPGCHTVEINQSLWAEREDPRTPADPDGICPKLTGGILDRVCWIHPNGEIGSCGYFSDQHTGNYGDLRTKSLADIWQSPERAAMLTKIRNREIKSKMCNPACCKLYKQE